MAASKKLEIEIAAISDLSREELVARWVKAYGCYPPKGLKRGLLERSAAWHQQVRRLGGLSPEATRTLKRLGGDCVSSDKDSSGDLPASGAVTAPDHNNGGSAPIYVTKVAVDSDMAKKRTPEYEVAYSDKSLPSQTASPLGVATSANATSASPPLRARPSVGTRLVREWKGRTHVVEVTEKGFVMDGKSYRSLSAVARRITGAHWSGPRFFGL